MRPYRFVHVDVFTPTPFGGNQLAVFTDARGLSAAEMQTLAREMNFAAHPDPTALQHILPPDTCAYLFTREAQDLAHQVHARMFNVNPLDLPEDAATGSAAGPLGAYLARHNLLPPGKFVIEQGYEMGRPSLIHVGVTEAGPISVGGQTVRVGEGVMVLP